MRRFTILSLMLLALGACNTSSPPTARPATSTLPHFVGLRTHRGMPSFQQGEHLAAEIVMLEERSPTFKDVLETLDSVPGLKALIEPDPVGTDWNSRRGRTVLRPSPASFAAWMQLPGDLAEPDATISAIARQFALVTEAACIGRYRTVVELRVAIGKRSGLGSAAELTDTPFSDAVEREVVWESQHPGEGETQFDALARQFDLRICRDGRRAFER